MVFAYNHLSLTTGSVELGVYAPTTALPIAIFFSETGGLDMEKSALVMYG